MIIWVKGNILKVVEDGLIKEYDLDKFTYALYFRNYKKRPTLCLNFKDGSKLYIDPSKKEALKILNQITNYFERELIKWLKKQKNSSNIWKRINT